MCQNTNNVSMTFHADQMNFDHSVPFQKGYSDLGVTQRFNYIIWDHKMSSKKEYYRFYSYTRGKLVIPPHQRTIDIRRINMPLRRKPFKWSPTFRNRIHFRSLPSLQISIQATCWEFLYNHWHIDWGYFLMTVFDSFLFDILSFSYIYVYVQFSSKTQLL